jgi:hypothetical protein
VIDVSWNAPLPITDNVPGVMVFIDAGRVTVSRMVFLNALLPIEAQVLVPLNTNVANEVHASNALEPIVVTLEGILIVCTLEQFINAFSSIVVTLPGMDTVARWVQSLNAFAPI